MEKKAIALACRAILCRNLQRESSRDGFSTARCRIPTRAPSRRPGSTASRSARCMRNGRALCLERRPCGHETAPFRGSANNACRPRRASHEAEPPCRDRSVRFTPNATLQPRMRSKKRLFSRCKAGAAGRRAAWAAAAHNVCRRSAVRADEPAATLLGSALRQTQSGCAAHPRIHPPFQVRSATVRHRRHGGVIGGRKGQGQGL
jgi:hypothetical protein